MSTNSANWNELFTCPSSSAVGDAVYLTGDQTVALADSSSVSKYAIGVIAYKESSTKCYVAFSGKVVSGLTGLTAGTKYYLTNSATTGNTTSTTESAQLIFIALTTTEVLIIVHQDGVSWDILKLPLDAAKTGTSAPTLTNMLGNLYVYAYSPTALNQQYLIIDMPNGWKEGSMIYPSIHWAPDNTDTGTIRWGFEYTMAVHGNAFGASTTIYVEQAAPGFINQHTSGDFSGIDMTGKTIRTLLICRIFRDAAHANDTFSGNAYGLSIKITFQKDTRGSSQQTAK